MASNDQKMFRATIIINTRAQCFPAVALTFLLAFADALIGASALSDIKSCSLSTQVCNSLAALNLDGELSFSKIANASRDFGNIHHTFPAAVLYPDSVKDIATVVQFVYASSSNLTIAAKGAGHSIYGQSQARDGIVIEMSSLKGIEVFPGAFGEASYVDARGGELWIDLITATMKLGFAPRSFTDYLHLSVGGTLSNAGVSGQAFRYGPQISNVFQLEVVTGKGEIVSCSPIENADLFFAVLGGLGQFGIITQARIVLEPSPYRVRWIRTLYSDFSKFTEDQENLISQPLIQSFDYIEGSVVVKAEDCCNSCKLETNATTGSSSPITISPVLYCLEVTKNYFEHESNTVERKISSMLAPLRHLPSMISVQDTTYLSFLDRVHESELRLWEQGLWSAPHPWLNLFIPKSRIEDFDAWTFKQQLRGGINGPMLIYPLHKMKWDPRMSVATPQEDIFYLVGLLRYASPLVHISIETLQHENNVTLKYCDSNRITYKQYLPNYSTHGEWIQHFGEFWPRFVDRKLKYDPKAILSPGQRIFSRPKTIYDMSKQAVN
ncbi:hypothetical protein O6H91_01G001900 [Diphasiastrum complanatum]|uniref:Uncharacterized protein n=1 Tax=Diphasiastrum complanatum TaxID=34168 RepID=A0ACC2EMK7_DIPCM|nr:hypothetical protein O6H91_01G001900 [Diphasiastrum complanatum]